MNLGEFIIKIGTQADTKQLEQTAKKLEEAEKKTRRLINYFKALSEATSDNEKKLIKKNFALQTEADKIKSVIAEQNAYNASMQKGIMTAIKFVGAIKLAVIVLDRMGNSLLKSNQQYVTFQKSTGMSIGRLQRMAGIASLSGMNLAPEQVAGDLQNLQGKIYDYAKGQGTGIFSQLGIMPMGMKSDQLIAVLRQRLKPYSGVVKSDILNQLGLSQEWLNVLDLSDEKFKEYLKTSQKLQLTEKERNILATYTQKQQENNMRWELAKQKLLIAVMPLIQKIMEWTSKIALTVTNFLEKSQPSWMKLLKDILLVMTGATFLKIIGGIGKLFTMGAGFAKVLGSIGKILAPLSALFGLKGLGAGIKAGGGLLGGLLGGTGSKIGKMFNTGKAVTRVAGRKGLGAALGMVGKRLLGGAAGFAFGPVIGAIFTIASTILILKDIKDLIMDWLHIKREEDEDMLTPDPDEGAPRYQYHNIKSNMTNNFFNNPQPANAAINELNNAINRYTQYQYR